MTTKTVEITKELFYKLANEDTVVIDIVSEELYTDVIYSVEETVLFRRSQNNYANYYIVDINS